ncbi:MAG: hypothetical protein JRH20_19345 [Deltaproteobacteria bacterium]|nr:hypothetical protein [Deltaproteobacteria bacterium]
MARAAPILAFEGEVVELERKATELERLSAGDVDFSREAARLRQKASALLRKGLAKLDGWQALQLAAHPSRPGPGDLLVHLLDKKAAVGAVRGDATEAGTKSALGELAERPVVLLAYDVGANLHSPSSAQVQLESLRCALRAVALAAQLGRPLVILINVLEQGSGEQVAGELGRLGLALADFEPPSVVVVTGQATGALAHVLMIADEVLMMRYAVLGGFSLAEVKAELYDHGTGLDTVAQTMIMTATTAQESGFVDGVVDEVEGGAQRDPGQACEILACAVNEALQRASAIGERLAQRATRAKLARGYKER